MKNRSWIGNLALIIGLFATTFGIIYFTEAYNKSQNAASGLHAQTPETWDAGTGASAVLSSASPDSVSGASASSSPVPDAGTGASLRSPAPDTGTGASITAPAPDAGTGASAVISSGGLVEYENHDDDEREHEDDAHEREDDDD